MIQFRAIIFTLTLIKASVIIFTNYFIIKVVVIIIKFANFLKFILIIIVEHFYFNFHITTINMDYFEVNWLTKICSSFIVTKPISFVINFNFN